MSSKVFICVIFVAIFCTACSSTNNSSKSNVTTLRNAYGSDNNDVGYTSYNGGVYTRPVDNNNASNNNNTGYNSYNTRPAGTYTYTVPVTQGYTTYYPNGGYSSYSTNNPQYVTYSYQV